MTDKPEGGGDQRGLNFVVPADESGNSGLVNNTRTNYKFQFNDVLPMDATQEDVFDRVAVDVINGALDGYNATIFAYGQTGSGKTFTLTGGAERCVLEYTK